MGTSIFSRRQRKVEADIAMLNRKRNSATEEDFKDVLRKYNLRDGLIIIGRASRAIFDADDQNKIGEVAYRDPDTGVTVTQFALGYLANIFLISGANDYKRKSLSNLRSNLFALCDSYNNCLIDPVSTKKGDLTDYDRLCSLLIRMYFEQQPYQRVWRYMIARTVVIFYELLHPDKFEDLSVIFHRKTGLSLYDYLRLCFVVSSWPNTDTFSLEIFTRADIPTLKDVLVEEKMIMFLNILKADYRKFRDEDARDNKNLDPIFTKTRFNPLSVYPIIETDKKHAGHPYVIPNIILYIEKAYGGLYWWFHRYFESRGEQKDFRTYFGYVFQEYVGKILKGIYGEQNVHEEIRYSRDQRRFIDWWVERDDKIYLFESKAYQFALLSKQTGDIKNEVKKIAKATKQVYDRIQDIPKYEELHIFSMKRVIPIIVFMDIPFVSSAIYEPHIKEQMARIEQEEQIAGLKDFSPFMMNIEELELYDECVDVVNLEEVLSKAKKTLYVKHFWMTVFQIRQIHTKLPLLRGFLSSGGDAPHHMFDAVSIEQR